MFVIAGLIIAAVLAQSVYFLIKAWKRGLAIGMGKEKLRRIARTAAVFTIAPAVAIVISVITLAKDLGVPLPWLRCLWRFSSTICPSDSSRGSSPWSETSWDLSAEN